MVKYFGELPEKIIRLTDKEGNYQDIELVGAFKNDKGYYIVVNVEEDGKQEYAMYRVCKNDDQTEYIQVITDREEWDLAYKSWVALTNQAKRMERINEI